MIQLKIIKIGSIYFMLLLILLLVLISCTKTHSNLGGGYKEAKWGMSKAEVRNHISGTIETYTSSVDSELKQQENLLTGVAESANDEWFIVTNDGKETSYHFLNDRLFGVKFNPNLPDVNRGQSKNGAAEAILSGLIEKFGEGDGYIKGMVNQGDFPLLVYRWNDGETTIKYIMWDPDWSASQFNGMVMLSSLSVEYLSNSILEEKKNSRR